MADAEKKMIKDSKEIFGYAGKLLRVDLTMGECTDDIFEEEFLILVTEQHRRIKCGNYFY